MSKISESVISELETSKLLNSFKPINEMMNMPLKEISIKCDFLKPINEVSSVILLIRQQCKNYFRKKTVELSDVNV